MTALPLTPEAARIFDEPEYRVEGPLKVTGRARYTSDVHFPDTLHARFLLSPHPHARIVSIDTAEARSVPGVHAVLTGQDIGDRRFGRYLYDWPVLAFERVLFVGERVAAVAAETREAADEAVSRIHVEYEELPAVLDFDAALAEGAPLLHPSPDGYYYLTGQRPAAAASEPAGVPTRPEGRAGHRTRLRPRRPRLRGRIFRSASSTRATSSRTSAWSGSTARARSAVFSTNKAPFALRHQLSVVTGSRAEQHRRGQHVHRRRLRREGPLYRGILLLLPGEGDGTAR